MPVKPAGLILAGGLSRRMGGGDKALLPLAGKPMLAHVIAALEPQACPLAVNANGDPSRFAAFGLPVVPDTIEGFAGPLAGILAGLDWCARLEPAPSCLVTVPADTPFLPHDLAASLAAAASPGAPCVAVSGGRVHPVAALWPVAMRDDIAAFLSQPDNRSVMVFLRSHAFTTADFPCPEGCDPFANVNTPEDLARAEHRLAGCD
ncbi:MAG: molybdenum cofactor guanylyltransferase MobA [Phyllobacteriaceae bacterium]|mgnify:CR=1 FL=1|nr:molybdenum cofactor guanylyltransferase MobA [Phyllobacteriaceae bacterium]MBA90440.1 molybdenum cofactor guanylyltransferase MobA [Phyllobacteriaceae bacterium]